MAEFTGRAEPRAWMKSSPRSQGKRQTWETSISELGRLMTKNVGTLSASKERVSPGFLPVGFKLTFILLFGRIEPSSKIES